MDEDIIILVQTGNVFETRPVFAVRFLKSTAVEYKRFAYPIRPYGLDRIVGTAKNKKTFIELYPRDIS